jgi:hypothetical protein
VSTGDFGLLDRLRNAQPRTGEINDEPKLQGAEKERCGGMRIIAEN